MADGMTRDAVVDAALKLLAQGGLGALAMRRIAGELGVQQSALYWYFDSKQEILAAVADALLAPIEVAPADQPWQERVVAQAAQLRAQLLCYPDGAELVATSFAFRLGARRPYQQFVAVLADAGFMPDQADIGASVLFHFVLGHVTDEQQNQQAAAIGAIKDGRDPTDHRSTAGFVEGVRLIAAGIDTRSRP